MASNDSRVWPKTISYVPKPPKPFPSPNPYNGNTVAKEENEYWIELFQMKNGKLGTPTPDYQIAAQGFNLTTPVYTKITWSVTGWVGPGIDKLYTLPPGVAFAIVERSKNPGNPAILANAIFQGGKAKFQFTTTFLPNNGAKPTIQYLLNDPFAGTIKK